MRPAAHFARPGAAARNSAPSLLETDLKQIRSEEVSPVLILDLRVFRELHNYCKKELPRGRLRRIDDRCFPRILKLQLKPRCCKRTALEQAQFTSSLNCLGSGHTPDQIVNLCRW